MAENGFLTDRDRAFLKGEKEYTGKNARHLRYQARRAIRGRTRAAFRDFALLYDVLDEDERKKIFNISDDPFDVEGGISTETRDGITDTLGFLYLSLEGEVGEKFARRTQPGIPSFEDALERAVAKAERDRHAGEAGAEPFVSTKLHIDVTSEVDIAAAAEKLARGEVWDLSETELRALAQSAVEKVDDFAYEPLIEEKRKEMGMEPEEMRAEVKEWFEERHDPSDIDDLEE